VNKLDVGTWQCKNKGNATQLRITSNKALIKLSELKKPTHPIITVTWNTSEVQDSIIFRMSVKENTAPVLTWNLDDGKTMKSDMERITSEKHADDVKIGLYYLTVKFPQSNATLQCKLHHAMGNWITEIKVSELKKIFNDLQDNDTDVQCTVDQNATSIALYVLLPICIIIIGVLVAVIVYSKNQTKKTLTSAAETQGEEMVPLPTTTR